MPELFKDLWRDPSERGQALLLSGFSKGFYLIASPNMLLANGKY